MGEIRPIFVLGAPRSGTTLIGNYIGSCRSVYNVGEYRAFYVTRAMLPAQITGISPPAWDAQRLRYLEEVQEHAGRFIEGVARDAGCTAYCDATPMNVYVGRELARLYPRALFILTLRHFTGVVQSLERNYFPWVEPTWTGRAQVWDASYKSSAALPRERTIPISYDRLCAEPAATMARFKKRLATARFPVDELDDKVLADSHATAPGGRRLTVADPADGSFHSIPSFDASSWTEAIDAEVTGLVAATDDLLRVLHGDEYSAPLGYGSSKVAGR